MTCTGKSNSTTLYAAIPKKRQILTLEKNFVPACHCPASIARVKVWDFDNGQFIKSLDGNDKERMVALKLIDDDTFLYCYYNEDSGGYHIRVFDIESNRNSGGFCIGVVKMNNIHVSDDTRVFVTYPSNIKIWNLSTGITERTINVSNEGRYNTRSAIMDGDKVIQINDVFSSCLFDTEKCQVVRRFKENIDEISVIDSERFLTSNKGFVKFWSINRDKSTKLGCYGWFIYGLYAMSDGKHFLMQNSQKDIYMCNMEKYNDGRLFRHRYQENDFIEYIAQIDETRFLTGSLHGTISVWDFTRYHHLKPWILIRKLMDDGRAEKKNLGKRKREFSTKERKGATVEPVMEPWRPLFVMRLFAFSGG